MVDNTARNSRAMPSGEAAKPNDGVNTTMQTPANDTSSPVMLAADNFSLKKYQAANGVINGMVATITAATVDETYISP